MDTLNKFASPGVALLLTLIFGFWLSKVGKPYNSVLFNIHKLTALGAVILTAVQVYKIFMSSAPQTLIVILIGIIAICVIALFASGAFMSVGNLDYKIMKTIHNIAPILAAVAMSLAIYLVVGKIV